MEFVRSNLGSNSVKYSAKFMQSDLETETIDFIKYNLVEEKGKKCPLLCHTGFFLVLYSKNVNKY